jgi:hypothetical protein
LLVLVPLAAGFIDFPTMSSIPFLISASLFGNGGVP